MKIQKLFKFLMVGILFIFPLLSFAESATPLPTKSPSINKNTNQYVYTLLAPMPGLLGTSIDTRNGLGAYLNTLYKAGIAIATGLAVLMIVFGGIQYVSSDAINGKSEGKAKIQDALIGLILAFMSYLLLNTLNPDLLKNDLILNNVEGGGTLNITPLRKGSMVNVPDKTTSPSTQNPQDKNQPPFKESPLPSGNGDVNQPNPLLPPIEDPSKTDYEVGTFS